MVHTNDGLLLKCDLEGVIREINYNHIHPDIDKLKNHLFADILLVGSIRKGLDFLIDIGKNSASFGWELLLKTDFTHEPLYFGGALLGDQMLIFGSYSKVDFARFMANLMLLNSEQVNQIRALEKELRSNFSVEASDTNLFNEMSRLNNELVGMQRQLLKKNQELDDLNMQKNRFLGMAAHDLRSPLGQILNFTEILIEESGSFSEEHKKYLGIMQSLSSSMLRLVSDLLDVSAIEDGKIALHKETFDMVQFLKQAVELNNDFAMKKSIRVSFHYETASCIFSGDSGKISQVVDNLLTNAVKFSNPGSQVEVTLKADATHLILLVSDRGQGINAEDIPILFKPFTRTSTKTTGGEPSAGLGLFIVKSIIEAHHGTIEVASKPGEGTTFTVRLPQL